MTNAFLGVTQPKSQQLKFISEGNKIEEKNVIFNSEKVKKKKNSGFVPLLLHSP